MSYSIRKTNLEAQTVLVKRKQIKPAEIAQVLGEMFQQVFLYAQQSGIVVAGAPFVQYLTMGREEWTIEAGFPVAGDANASGEIKTETLPGGPAAVTIHSGPYDKLREAHQAIHDWLTAEGLEGGGPPRESYITDPGAHPDPQDWKTEVIVPLSSR
jgi:AraC family transcriptional regulator